MRLRLSGELDILGKMSSPRFMLWLMLWVLSMATTRAQPELTSEYFQQHVRPLLKDYCFPCHSTEKHKGDFDMERFGALAEIKRHPKIWQTVTEQLANSEMPPKEKPQPSPAEKELITKWLLGVLEKAGEERAGDPGPVVLRRLSNAEYNYTIQDLTGVESLQPAREFPVDGAAGEGFMNTGQALVMSPSLITKYLDAAKEVAGHAVLLPDGIRFSAKTTRRDFTQEIVEEIRKFYADFTDSRGGDEVNLQGIVFETNEGGRLPIQKYLAATIEEREALATGKKTSQQVAAEQKLNDKYLQSLIELLSSKERSTLLDKLKLQWKTAKKEDLEALTAEIKQWQKALWKFNTVGHIGKANGPNVDAAG